MTSIDDGIEEYRSVRRRSFLIIAGLCALTAVLTIFSLPLDKDVHIGFFEAFGIIGDRLAGKEPDNFTDFLKDRIVFEDNAPKVIGAALTGGVLAVCGAVLQSLIRNPLAEPYTLGMSSGALFGMVAYVALGISIVPFVGNGGAGIANAFVFALIPTAAVVFVSAFKKVTPTMMILCGIAVMYIFSAFNTLIRYTTDNETLSNIYQWSVGSLSGLSWGSLWKMAVALVMMTAIALHLHNEIDIVAQGDNNAVSLGINPNGLRIAALVAASVATALVVCYTGTIGFVGLVAPHIARRLVGPSNGILVPCSAALGAFMVVGSDFVLRAISPSLPVGVMLALVCGPVFIYILVTMKRNTW